MILDVPCITVVLPYKMPCFNLQITKDSIHNNATLGSLCKRYPPTQDALLLYCFYCWYVFICISTLYLFMLLLSSSFVLYEPILVLGVPWKTVTNASHIICLPVLILAPQPISCSLLAHWVGYIYTVCKKCPLGWYTVVFEQDVCCILYTASSSVVVMM